MAKFVQGFTFSGNNLKSHSDVLIGVILIWKSICADIKHNLLEEILTLQLKSFLIKFQTF